MRDTGTRISTWIDGTLGGVHAWLFIGRWLGGVPGPDLMRLAGWLGLRVSRLASRTSLTGQIRWSVPCNPAVAMWLRGGTMTRNPMSSTVTVGHSSHADARHAARESARQARQRLPEDVRPGWLLAFAGGRHDPAELLKGFRAALGELPIVGGCGSGLITADAASSSGYECGVLLFPDSLLPAAILKAEGLEDDEQDVGRRLGADLRALALTPDSSVLLFYDSIKCGSPPVLHLGSRLLDGLYAGLGDCQPRVIGAGTLADLALSSGCLLYTSRRG